MALSMDPASGERVRQVREESLRLATDFGYSITRNLPLLDSMVISRTALEVARRALVLHACCAVSYGFSSARAQDWLLDNDLQVEVTTEERLFLDDGRGVELFRVRPEAIWALCWVLQKAPSFSLQTGMPQRAVELLPNLQDREAPSAWIASCALRDSLETLRALDFYYCVHWSIREAILRDRPEPTIIPPYIVLERRRALEWCCGADDWDDLPLDT